MAKRKQQQKQTQVVKKRTKVRNDREELVELVRKEIRRHLSYMNGLALKPVSKEFSTVDLQSRQFSLIIEHYGIEENHVQNQLDETTIFLHEHSPSRSVNQKTKFFLPRCQENGYATDALEGFVDNIFKANIIKFRTLRVKFPLKPQPEHYKLKHRMTIEDGVEIDEEEEIWDQLSHETHLAFSNYLLEAYRKSPKPFVVQRLRLPQRLDYQTLHLPIYGTQGCGLIDHFCQSLHSITVVVHSIFMNQRGIDNWGTFEIHHNLLPSLMKCKTLRSLNILIADDPEIWEEGVKKCLTTMTSNGLCKLNLTTCVCDCCQSRDSDKSILADDSFYDQLIQLWHFGASHADKRRTRRAVVHIPQRLLPKAKKAAKRADKQLQLEEVGDDSVTVRRDNRTIKFVGDGAEGTDFDYDD